MLLAHNFYLLYYQKLKLRQSDILVILAASVSLMKKVTLDTTMNPNDPLVTSAVNAGHDICYTSVTSREASGADFKVKLCTISSVQGRTPVIAYEIFAYGNDTQ